MCALGPYCMTWEPAFFRDMQFLIDDFHLVGHTKCSPAAFLKSHCNVDPHLAYINSSAGECVGLDTGTRSTCGFGPQVFPGTGMG
jgi:hypothetical protein